MSATVRASAPSTSGSQTVILENQANPPRSETLVLRLNPKKNKVTWKEGTMDNEFMGKKSSKKCCIFHKEKSFDEDVSDDEGDLLHKKPHRHGDGDDHGHEDGGCYSSSNGDGSDWFLSILMRLLMSESKVPLPRSQLLPPSEIKGC